MKSERQFSHVQNSKTVQQITTELFPKKTTSRQEFSTRVTCIHRDDVVIMYQAWLVRERLWHVSDILCKDRAFLDGVNHPFESFWILFFEQIDRFFGCGDLNPATCGFWRRCQLGCGNASALTCHIGLLQIAEALRKACWSSLRSSCLVATCRKVDIWKIS